MRYRIRMGDLRFALRQLRMNPGFACTAVLVLALAIAASVSIFAFVDAALVQSLPYRDPARLVAVYEAAPSCRDCSLSYPEYLDWKRDNRVFESLEAWNVTVYLWRSPAGVLALRAARVSGGFFRMLGVTPFLGRGFTEEDDRPAAPRTVLLPYRTWQSRFGGRAEVVGQSIILNDQAYIVIGVLPREFHFPLRAAEFWTTIHDRNGCEALRSCHDVSGVARMREGISLQVAMSDMQARAAHLAQEFPESSKGRGAAVIPLREALVGDIRPTLLLLWSGAGLLLLIAYVNVASLLLVRGENRRREMALRGALGASQGRLLRLFVAEGMVLAGTSATLGLAAAYLTIPWLFQLIPERLLRGLPYFLDVGLHARSLLFASAASLIAVAICSLTPALRLSLSNLRDDLAQGGRSSAGTAWKRFGSNLVAVELAIAMILLAGAGLLGKSLYRLLHVQLNFRPDHTATLEIDTPPESYGKAEQRIALARRINERISRLPAVVAVAQVSELPVTCNCGSTRLRVVGHAWDGEHHEALERSVAAGYFQVIQARRTRGRFFDEADDRSQPAIAVINQTLAARFFPGEDPVGRMLGDERLSPESLRQVVGVVDDIREGGLNEELQPAIYVP